MRFFLFLVIMLFHVAATANETVFEADSQVALLAAKKAQELVDFASATYAVKLDWSDESIDLLDELLNKLHETYLEEQPEEQYIFPVAQGFGSYIGEVYRRNHGGTWGWITQDDDTFAGIKPERGGPFWPWAKALDRIKTNTEPTISDYYHFLVIR